MLIRYVPAACFLSLLLTGCGSEPAPQETSTGVPEVVGDTQLLREAQSLSNGIIRNAADCAAVEASYRDVVQKLDEIERVLSTEAGRSTLATLRTQIARVAEPCGVR